MFVFISPVTFIYRRYKWRKVHSTFRGLWRALVFRIRHSINNNWIHTEIFLWPYTNNHSWAFKKISVHIEILFWIDMNFDVIWSIYQTPNWKTQTKGQTRLNFKKFNGIQLPVLEFQTWLQDTYYLQILMIKCLKP